MVEPASCVRLARLVQLTFAFTVVVPARVSANASSRMKSPSPTVVTVTFVHVCALPEGTSNVMSDPLFVLTTDAPLPNERLVPAARLMAPLTDITADAGTVSAPAADMPKDATDMLHVTFPEEVRLPDVVMDGDAVDASDGRQVC